MAILKRTHLETADLVSKNGFYKEIVAKNIIQGGKDERQY